MAKTHKTEGSHSSHNGAAAHDGRKHKGAQASHATHDSKSKSAHHKASHGKNMEEEGEE